MKSILHQLKKYETPSSTQVEIKLDDKMAPLNDELAAIAYKITYGENPEISVPPEHAKIVLERRYNHIYSLLQSMLPSDNAGKLYPKITLARYHLGYNCQTLTSEEATDSEIKAFIQAVPNIEEYKIGFAKACGARARKLIMIRALLATFNFGNKPADNLPVYHREIICKAIGVPSSIIIRDVARLQEMAERDSSIDELILGRLGYVIIWRALQQDTPSGHKFIGNLSCKSITLLPPGQASGGSKQA